MTRSGPVLFPEHPCLPSLVPSSLSVVSLRCAALAPTAEAAKSAGKESTAQPTAPQRTSRSDPLGILPRDAQKLALVVADGFESFRLGGAIEFVRHLDSLSPVDLNSMVGPTAQLEAAYGRPTHFEVVSARALSPAGRQFELRALSYHKLAAVAYRAKLYQTADGWALTAVEIQSGYLEAFLDLPEMQFDALNKELKSGG